MHEFWLTAITGSLHYGIIGEGAALVLRTWLTSFFNKCMGYAPKISYCKYLCNLYHIFGRTVNYITICVFLQINHSLVYLELLFIPGIIYRYFFPFSGDPADTNLRRVEREVLIPKIMKIKAHKEKCQDMVECMFCIYLSFIFICHLLYNWIFHTE